MGLSRSSKVKLMLGLTTGLFLLEIIVGNLVGSIALVADSLHMLNDLLSLVVALWAMRLAKQPTSQTSPRYTYGFQRAEVLGALCNAVLLLGLCLVIYIEALQRFLEPRDITHPKAVLTVGTIGLFFNILGLLIFHEHGHAHGHGDHAGHQHAEDEVAPLLQVAAAGAGAATESRVKVARRKSFLADLPIAAETQQAIIDVAAASTTSPSTSVEGTPAVLPTTSAVSAAAATATPAARPKDSDKHEKGRLNMHGVWLHIMGDALASFAVISSGLFIWLTDYSWRHMVDPIVSIVVNTLVVMFTLPLIRSAAHILLQSAPTNINIPKLESQIRAVKGVGAIHELHVWQLSDTKTVASVHIVNATHRGDKAFVRISRQVRHILHKHGVHSATIQPEFVRSNGAPLSGTSSTAEPSSPNLATTGDAITVSVCNGASKAFYAKCLQPCEAGGCEADRCCAIPSHLLDDLVPTNVEDEDHTVLSDDEH
ncbi:cation efflux protein [Ramicandelaber brevisporus]|nr:cation efflux protein [Ramicandelaber brevisporus]